MNLHSTTASTPDAQAQPAARPASVTITLDIPAAVAEALYGYAADAAELPVDAFEALCGHPLDNSSSTRPGFLPSGTLMWFSSAMEANVFTAYETACGHTATVMRDRGESLLGGFTEYVVHSTRRLA